MLIFIFFAFSLFLISSLWSYHMIIMGSWFGGGWGGGCITSWRGKLMFSFFLSFFEVFPFLHVPIFISKDCWCYSFIILIEIYLLTLRICWIYWLWCNRRRERWINYLNEFSCGLNYLLGVDVREKGDKRINFSRRESLVLMHALSLYFSSVVSLLNEPVFCNIFCDRILIPFGSYACFVISLVVLHLDW